MATRACAQTTNRRGRGYAWRIDNTRLALALLVVALGGAFLLGLSVGGGTPERQALAYQEHATLLPWKIASRITGYVVWGIGAQVGAAVMAGYIVFYMIAIGRNWLNLRSRQIHAKDGLFPVIELQAGVLYDPNRDNAGAHPLITTSALSVQKTAAMKADKILIRQNDRPAIRQDDAMALPQPVLNWPSRVPLRGLLDGPASLNDLVLGVTLDGNGQSHVVRGAMGDLVHVAVGGSSGWGKSVFLQALAFQLVTALEKPDLCMIDLEGVTLNAFAQSERLLYPIADSEQAALALLLALNGELERRKELFNRYPGIDRLDRYNATASEPLKPIITVIDEATALLDNKSIEAHLKELTLRARKYGLWLILAGQDWKATSLDTAIRNQLSTRVQFKALNASQSRVLIGEGDAKDLDAVGRALAVSPGKPMLELQAPYVNAGMILEAVKGNGAQRALDLTAVNLDVTQDDKEARIIALLTGGRLPDSKIASMVYGYNNARTVEKVKELRRRRQNDSF